MSDAIAFLLILPVLVLGVAVLDAAGTLGTAAHRTSVYAEAAAVRAAHTLSRSPASGGAPSDRARWSEAASAAEQGGLAATSGVCDQGDADFDIGLVSQPRSGGNSGSSPSVAVVVSCPVELGRLLIANRIVATGVEPLD